MRNGWISFVLASCASCALFGTHVDVAAFDAEFTRCERALDAGELEQARAAIDVLTAAALDTTRRARAQRLEGVVAARELQPFEELFAELGGALAAKDTALAQRILARVLALDPRGAAATRAQAYRNIVDGRSSSAAIEMQLEAEPTATPGEYRIVLMASQSTGERVRIRCPGSALDFAYVGVSEAGIETRTKRRLHTDALEDLELESGVPRRVVLAAFELPVGGLIACRGDFSLAALAGSIQRGGRELPANEFVIRACFAERRDARLPSGVVEPSECAAYVERGAPSIAALLERAARVEPVRRLEALDLASTRLRASTDAELERLAPALRWLSSSKDPPVDGAGWRAWLERRANELAKPTRPTLELPVR